MPLSLWYNVKNIFNIIIIFQCIFFAIYLLSQHHEKKRSNVLLVAFLAVILVIETGGVAIHFRELYHITLAYFPQVHSILYPFRYLYIPLLYLYVLSFSREDFRFRPVQLLHAVPFLAVMLLFLVKYTAQPTDVIRAFLEQNGYFLSDTEASLFTAIEFIQFSLYAILSLVVLTRYNRKMENQYSSLEKINLAWLKYVVYGFIAWKSLTLINIILSRYFQNVIHPYTNMTLYIASQITFLAFLSVMFFKGLKQPAVFSGSNGNQSGPKYEKVPLSTDLKEEYRNRLLQYMEHHKPYLDPSLSLKELAAKLVIPAHHLSQVLNTIMEQNFFDFINTYRITESIRILSEDTTQSKTVLEVLYQSGFNSKSVFNSAFKKQTGMTPSQFRRQHVS